MATTTRNLMFLLAAAPMAISGCVVTTTTDAGTTEDETTGDGDGDATASGDGDGDPSGDGDGDPSGDGDGDPATGDGDGDPMGDGDGDPTGDGDGDQTGDGDGDSDPTACEAFGEKYVECFAEAEEPAAYYAMYCQDQIDEYAQGYGPDCAVAFEAYFACIAALDCEQFGMPMVCEDAFLAAAQICGL